MLACSAKHSRAPHTRRLTAGTSNCASSRRNLHRQQETSSLVAASSLVEDGNQISEKLFAVRIFERAAHPRAEIRCRTASLLRTGVNPKLEASPCDASFTCHGADNHRMRFLPVGGRNALEESCSDAVQPTEGQMYSRWSSTLS
jgi:hypothetical protein